jgi:hypothetical protein
VELIVGALVVLGFVAVLTRFITRDASGQVRLPRIVDESIGMWTLRRVTGRRLGERPWVDEIDGEQLLDPNAADATRAALGAIAAANAAHPTLGPARGAMARDVPVPNASARAAPPRAAPARSVAPRRRTKAHPVRSGSMTSPTPVLDLRRRQEARARPRRSPWWPRSTALGLAVVLIVAVVAIGIALQATRPQGRVLAATGRPQLSLPSTQIAAGAAGVSQSAEPATASVQVTVSRDVTLPKATITSLTKSRIAGSTKLRVALAWTLTDSGSGLRRQLLQRRTDGGAWVTVSLASVSTRNAAFAMSRGHTYTFRIRGTDRAGNVGLFVSKSIRI